MSFVVVAPELLTAAAADLANIGSTIGEANAAVADPTTAVLGAGADEVSAAISALFNTHTRKPVAGPSGAAVTTRLSAQVHRHGISLYAVDPAYTSAWGDQHWRTPYQNVTRHEAAATVIGRRAQGLTARRRKGVTRTRPEDRGVRATDRAMPEHQRATSSRHRSGTRETESRAPDRARTRLRGRATVTPAMANNGQLHL